MPLDTTKQIAKYKARLAVLEQKLYAELALLPGRYGFASADEFVAALKRASAVKPSFKVKAAAKTKTAPKGRKKRAKITPEIEAQVKALAEAGKTGAEISKTVGISLPSVQNVKKKLGLAKPRQAKA